MTYRSSKVPFEQQDRRPTIYDRRLTDGSYLWAGHFLGIGMPGIAIFRERGLRSLDQQLDRIGQVRLLNIVRTFRHPQPMSFEQDLAVGHTRRRLEFVAG